MQFPCHGGVEMRYSESGSRILVLEKHDLSVCELRTIKLIACISNEGISSSYIISIGKAFSLVYVPFLVSFSYLVELGQS